VRETIDRLAAKVTSLGLMVFARIDHAAGAGQAGMPLRPTELLIFGNPKGGTPLMQDQQTAGIDLPVKVLAWEDANGKVWLTYNDAAWLAERHGLGPNSADRSKPSQPVWTPSPAMRRRADRLSRIGSLRVGCESLGSH
jgi:uncharacterized protein (DUF302 family)